MKYLIKTIAFSLILFPFTLQSQSLLVDGMEWYYTVTFFFQGDEIPNHCYIEGDIEIQQKDCKIYHREVTTCNQRYVEQEYLYEEDQKVFFYDFNTETFKLLYDYSMEVGDTLTLELWEGMAFENDSGNFDSLYYMTVDSIDIIEYNNQEFRRFFVRYDRWNDLEINFTDSGIIVEYFGNIVDYFHFRDNGLCDDRYNNNIRCFEHPDFGFIQLQNVACDSVITNLNEEFIENNLLIYPNPFTENMIIEVNDLQINGFQIVDLTGKRLFKNSQPIMASDHFEMTLAFLKKGIYFIEIQTEKGVISKKIIKN